MYRLDYLDTSEDENERYRLDEERRERERREVEEECAREHERQEHERRREEAQQEEAWMTAQAEEQAQEQHILSAISDILNKKMTTMTEDEFVAWISGLYLKHGQSLFFEGLSLSYIIAEIAIWCTYESKFGTIGYSPIEILSRLFNTKTLDMFCFEDEDDYKIKA
jgi:hypothetical protein